jgi:hypothetical protein
MMTLLCHFSPASAVARRDVLGLKSSFTLFGPGLYTAFMMKAAHFIMLWTLMSCIAATTPHSFDLNQLPSPQEHEAGSSVSSLPPGKLSKEYHDKLRSMELSQIHHARVSFPYSSIGALYHECVSDPTLCVAATLT